MSISGMIAVVSGFAAVAGGKSYKSGNSTSTVQGISGVRPQISSNAGRDRAWHSDLSS